jgi:hypothetical protein
MERRLPMAIGMGQGHGGGPKTDEGKRRASLNSLRHGLAAESDHAMEALEYEPGVEFQPMLDEAPEYFMPANPVEEKLVRLIARCWWRCARIEQLEDRSIERNPYKLLPVNARTGMLRYERQVDLQLHRALRALYRVRGYAEK